MNIPLYNVFGPLFTICLCLSAGAGLAFFLTATKPGPLTEKDNKQADWLLKRVIPALGLVTVGWLVLWGLALKFKWQV